MSNIIKGHFAQYDPDLVDEDFVNEVAIEIRKAFVAIAQKHQKAKPSLGVPANVVAALSVATADIMNDIFVSCCTKRTLESRDYFLEHFLESFAYQASLLSWDTKVEST